MTAAWPTPTPQRTTAQAAEGHWRSIGPGLQLKVLQRAGEVMSYLVRMAPGSALPAHRQPIDEECVVPQGAVPEAEIST